ncbi:RPA-related protein RADX isoform X2 [Salarias fasciatus]|uniref:RPA-related protein RADX isoform X2 n=1 Tax=Salarias fasciatus TaxID=181472 RepID=UPI0011769986|nr:RPA-related protein RADX-like isoform X2 [Salarias fasciatus]
MAAAGCVLLRTLRRSRPGPGPDWTRDRPSGRPDRPRDTPGLSQASPVLCRDVLRVLDLRRYTRDQGSSVYFPEAVLCGDDLYDVTLTDGDCRLQVTLDPGLNRLVERRVLRPGRALYSSAFSPALSAQLPACPGAGGDADSFRLVSVELRDEAEDGGRPGTDGDWDELPWFGSCPPAGPLAPLRANRSVFLPLWNNVDPSGDAWTQAPPPEDRPDPEEDRPGGRPVLSVSRLRDDFLSGRRRLTRGTVDRQLIVRILNKSRLLYFGKTDRNCACPYKALLEVCDPTGCVCVVLWNSVCVRWFCRLQPGDIISLRRYRVKLRYAAGSDDIELSANSRNPHTHISLLPQSSVSPAHLPAPPTYTFCNSQELLDRRHGDVCDVIGLLTFSGRSERIRSEDGREAGLLEYRWLRLEDGASDQPIMVKLFSTSQPDVHQQLLPMSVVVCCRLKVVHCPPSCFLTNTTFTQVYCTGHHSQMPYRKLRPVRSFLRWLRLQDDQQVLRRALIGGFFVFPPPPVSLETLMQSSGGDLGFLRGAELQRVVETLCYRERRTLCIQATVTMVTCGGGGEDVRSWAWTDRNSSIGPVSSCSPLPPSRPPSSLSSCCRVSLSSPSSAHSPRTPRRSSVLKRKRLFSAAEASSAL